jgi:uridine kinase
MNEEAVLVEYDGKRHEVKIGTTLQSLAGQAKPSNRGPYVAARVNGVLAELTNKIYKPCTVQFIDSMDKEGNLMVLRGLCFVLVRAARELFAGARVTIEHSLGGGLYAEIHTKISSHDVEALEKRMHEIAEEDSPFVRHTVSTEEAMELFERDGQPDKVRLLAYRPFDFFRLYENGGVQDYFYGLMVPSTGYLKEFRLFSHYPGVVLCHPRPDRAQVPEELKKEPKLSTVYREAKHWASILNCENVCDLNDMVKTGQIGDFIRVNEALHEKKIIEAAEEITREGKEKRLILIAGPSSSGKTTFAQRLSIHLRVLGKRPVSISVDNYYRSREEIPRDAFGMPDLEHIDAIDVSLFNEQIFALFQGAEVELPRFDFQLGRRVPGPKLQISSQQPIIVEGIHGLNPALTPIIPDDIKYRIYVSALTQLNLDDHNRIPGTDGRLLRRLVRDQKFRNSSAERTLGMWESVRKGEERFIFPFQEEADMIFNSTLVYEIAVLKKYAVPVIETVQEQSEHFSEAARLKKFLNYFTTLEDESDIPTTSILREFIGESCFYR